MTHDLRMVLPAATAWGVAAWLTAGTSTTALWCAVIALVVAGLCWSRMLPATAVALCVAAVSVSCAWRIAVVESSPVADLAARSGTASLTLEVRGEPRGFRHHGQASAVVPVVVRRIATHRGDREVRVRAVAFVAGDVADLSVGRRFEAFGRLGPSDRAGEAALIRVVHRDRSTAAPWWWDGSEVVRDGVRTAVDHLGAEPKALIPALVMGDDSGLDESVKEDFRRSGLTHLLAVSGTNLTIVLVTVLLMGRAWGARRRTVGWAGALAVVGFVLLARPDPSVLRAAAMGAVGLAAVEFGGRGGMRALSWAIVVLVFVDPWLARSLGFVLSVCATAGIVLLGPALTRSFGTWMPRWCAVAIAVPLAAQLACTPAIAAISGEISLVAVAANIAAAPAVAPATVAGLAGGLLALVVPTLGQWSGSIAGWCDDLILSVGHRSADLEGAAVSWSLSWMVLVALLPGAAWIGVRASRHPAAVIGLCVGLGLSMWRPPSPGWPPTDWLLVVCDVGQGSAYVVNGGSAVMVVDAGPDPALINRCLSRLQVRQIDVMVFTHDHADHTAGWSGVRDHRAVRLIVEGSSGGPEYGAAHQTVAGESWALGDASVRVVWPASSTAHIPSSADGATINNTSAVLLVESPGVRLLLTGDVEPEAQDSIVRSGVDIRADVMTVPHHGSARQSERFISHVAPSIAIVSAGEDNDYGHPAASALAMFRQHGAAVWRTDLQGDVIVARQGGSIVVLTR